MHNRFLGQQDNWENSFNNENSDNIVGRIKLSKDKFQLEPFVRIHRVSNYLYYGIDLRPAQASSDILQTTIGTNLNIKIAPSWTWSNSFYYNNLSGGSADVFRIPQVMALSQIAHINELFDGRMAIQVGADIHYRSKFTGYGYNPFYSNSIYRMISKIQKRSG